MNLEVPRLPNLTIPTLTVIIILFKYAGQAIYSFLLNGAAHALRANVAEQAGKNPVGKPEKSASLIYFYVFWNFFAEGTAGGSDHRAGAGVNHLPPA
jgi:hypothetical protein